jgi:MoxR-like ATPase
LISIARDCDILSCEAGEILISNRAHDCEIISCISGKNIAGSVDGGKIRSCKSGEPIVGGVAKKSMISDCLVVMNVRRASDLISQGGIASELIGSTVERCFVTGSWDGSVKFSGIAQMADDSTIRACALGHFDLTGPLSFWLDGIAAESKNNSSFEKNFTIDSINFKAHQNGAWGALLAISVQKKNAEPTKSEPIAAARFKQRFFENTLGWDFETVWVWDDQNDRPALRQVGIDATPTPTGASSPAKAASTVDLLTHQVKANICL